MIYILWLSNSHNNAASIQKNRADKSHHVIVALLGRRQANLCFHFAGSGENLPDITKSPDASLDNDLLALSSTS